jgi:hypothetical protein
MRDPNRITPFVKKFEEIWKNHPDLRFGQIVDILIATTGKNQFYVEDDVVLQAMYNF